MSIESIIKSRAWLINKKVGALIKSIFDKVIVSSEKLKTTVELLISKRMLMITSINSISFSIITYNRHYIYALRINNRSVSWIFDNDNYIKRSIFEIIIRLYNEIVSSNAIDWNDDIIRRKIKLDLNGRLVVKKDSGIDSRALQKILPCLYVVDEIDKN
jgi:hypothetical protein